jgi:DNA-binding NtrC family response regulator
VPDPSAGFAAKRSPRQAEAAPPTIDGMAPAEIHAAPLGEFSGSSPKIFDETERELIERARHMAGHNKTYAAELLKISRKKLYARLAKYGLLNHGRRARRGAYPSAHPISCTP